MALVTFGAITSCVGIVIAAAGNPTSGGVIVLAGWLAMVAGIHRFGRAG
jgi:hypothetical protein